MAKKSFTVKIPFERSTPGTHLYSFKNDRARGQDAVVKNVYITQDGFEPGIKTPSEVDVTITYDDGK
jgi:hypothetical protein